MADEPVIGYCVKCKEKREMLETQEVEMPGKGGARRAMKGKCSVCGKIYALDPNQSSRILVAAGDGVGR